MHGRMGRGGKEVRALRSCSRPIRNCLVNNSYGSLAPPIAAVSVAVQLETILQGILVYLLNTGWKRIAMLYDMRATNLAISKTLNWIH
ncbi:retinal guanylyl cyclase 2 [Echinococcus multilocularis]|uniref:Retinal guanylyl cyclase 2 n=1 Tax=Echinococcus multilocularis TaxID=6211 RepID=A0A0S4MJU3_ECHMU|nr:retinal guanylyl cyclase 2 [Echinococcus multilocularis]